MRAIIIDDEINCIGTLEILIGKHAPEVKILATCKSGAEGLEALEKHDPDLIFLDIAMPKMSGFEMLAKVDAPNFEIVFTTAYDAYALQAFKVSAVDYLLKPIDRDELLDALTKVKRRIELKKNATSPQSYPVQWERFLENLSHQNERFPNIALSTSDGIEMIPARSILYIEADGNYSRVRLQEDRSILVSKTLREMEETLDGYKFVRVHHSHLVNAREISKYVKGEGGYVILHNGEHINVSRRRKPELLKVLKNKQ